MNPIPDEALAKTSWIAGSRKFARVAVTALALSASLALRVQPIKFEHLADSIHYIAMAERSSAVVPAPFCYRVLVPALAGALPLDLASSFFALAFLFVTGTGVLVYYLLRQLGMDNLLAFSGLLLFYGLNWGPRFAFFDFRLTDPALFFFTAASLLLLLKSRSWSAVLTVSLGVLAKEAAFFVLPFAYTLRARRAFDLRALVTALGIAAIPVVLYFVLRWSIPGEYDPAGLWATIGQGRIRDGMSGLIRAGTLGTWGPVVLLFAVLSGRTGWRWAIRAFPFFFLVYWQPFFAINVDRLLVLAFPAVIPMAVFGLRSMQARFRLTPWMLIGYASLPYLLHLAKRRTSFNPASAEQELIALAAWSLIVFLARRRSVVKARV